MRAISAWCFTILLLVWAAPAGAEGSAAPTESWVVARGLTADELGRIAQELASDDAGRREGAVLTLTTLHPESLPGIKKRLRELSRRRPQKDDARAALTAFRHAVGSRRADDGVDIAPGVAKALAQQRSPARLAMAEPLLMLRALERMRSPEAGQRIADIFLLDEPGVWSHEARLVRVRGGLARLPSLIHLRGHESSRIRDWARSAVRALGMDDPKKATSIEDPELAARVIRAYADPLHFPAMPIIVRLVDSPSLQVRTAARDSVARFGKNAIWQLRELYQEIASEPASKRWKAPQTARELYARIDAPRNQRAAALLEQGMAAFVAGDLETMQVRYDLLLAQHPDFGERAKMAGGYAALGEAALAADALDRARDAYRRALRLDPDASEADAWRARLAFVGAERSLSRGVVDLPSYERALAHDPGIAAAATARDRLTGELAARKRDRKRLAAFGAIALLLGVLFLTLRPSRPTAKA